jgi:hypothetical protein
VKRLSQPDAVSTLAWLDERTGEGGFTGYDPAGWDAKVWIGHAMYETDELPGGITHDDVQRMELAAGTKEPAMIGDINLEEMLAEGKVIGSSLGASGWPGPGWRRLRWSELAARLDHDPYALDVPPCLRSFPYSSWPANIVPPAEGSLDREQFVGLLDHLAELSEVGYQTTCNAYYSPLASGDFDHHTVFRCELRELTKLYDDEDLAGSPNNVWPDDRPWLTFTDEDLWATKVSGSRELIERLMADDELETVALDF